MSCDGYNDPIMLPGLGWDDTTCAASDENSEETEEHVVVDSGSKAKAESTDAHHHSIPAWKEDVSEDDGRQLSCTESTALVQLARRPQFYRRTKAGHIIPRDDISARHSKKSVASLREQAPFSSTDSQLSTSPPYASNNRTDPRFHEHEMAGKSISNSTEATQLDPGSHEIHKQNDDYYQLPRSHSLDTPKRTLSRHQHHHHSHTRNEAVDLIPRTRSLEAPVPQLPSAIHSAASQGHDSSPRQHESQHAAQSPDLQLRVKGTDIRQDNGPPYQVYVMQARFGKKLWTVEKRLDDFCALDAELLRFMTTCTLPKAPRRRTSSMLSIATPAEDVATTMAELDMYVRALAALVVQLEEKRGVYVPDCMCICVS
jgi:hypothetical protein